MKIVTKIIVQLFFYIFYKDTKHHASPTINTSICIILRMYIVYLISLICRNHIFLLIKLKTLFVLKKIENILIQNIFLTNQYRNVFIRQCASYRTLPTYW